LNDRSWYGSYERIFVGVVSSSREYVDSPVFEETELLSQEDREEPLRSNVPEVTLEKAGVKGKDALVEPEVDRCLAVVTVERISSLLSPKVYHLSYAHCEGIGECCSQISTESGCEKD